jgi:hypothetical protein
MKDQLEHWNPYSHRSYVTSELYLRSEIIDKITTLL